MNSNFVRAGISATWVAFALVGCVEGTAPRAEPFAARAAVAQPSQMAKPSFLYVAGLPLSQYALGSSKPLRSIQSAYGIPAFVVNSAGFLFAETGNISGGFITVYDARTLKAVRGLANIFGTFFAADSKGYVYAAGCQLAIFVIAPDGSKVIHIMHGRLRSACALAFDRSDDLFATQGGSIKVFTPTKRPGYFNYLRSITDGITSPGPLAFGPDGDLFVTDCICYDKRGRRHNHVSVYAPGGSKPLRIVTEGIVRPVALAVDSKKTLYVANSPDLPRSYRRGWIAVYSGGGSKFLRKIRIGIARPVSLAVDGFDRLYVADTVNNAVMVYAPGGTKLLRTITDGVEFPNVLSVSAF